MKIPLLPKLRTALDAVPRQADENAPYCDAYEKTGEECFPEFLRRLGILDNEDGIAAFHSWREGFVSRLRAAGIDETVIRGVVGHRSSETTDLYDHDTSKAVEAFKRLG